MRLGTTLLPWQQTFNDDYMYFMLDHPCAKFQSNLTCIRWEIDCLNFHKTGILIIWCHKFCWTHKFFCPTNYTHFAIFTPFITLEWRYNEKQQIAFFSVLNGLLCESIKRRPKNLFHRHLKTTFKSVFFSILNALNLCRLMSLTEMKGTACDTAMKFDFHQILTTKGIISIICMQNIPERMRWHMEKTELHDNIKDIKSHNSFYWGMTRYRISFGLFLAVF